MKAEPEFVQTIIDMYSSGIEQKEITERTGQTYCVVRYWLKKKGLYDPNRRQTGTVHAMQGLDPHNRANEARKQDAENRLAQYLLDKGFSYIGGYTSKECHIQIACQKCGEVFTTFYDAHIYEKDTIICPSCKKQVCSVCGREFSVMDYAQENEISFAHTQQHLIRYCSDKCRRKAAKSSTHIKRAKKYGGDWQPGITLSALINRDGLRCAICGGMCDINDKSWGNASGPRYPSMDHIIPLSKGGSHTWNNVQVAHMLCNSFKGIKNL